LWIVVLLVLFAPVGIFLMIRFTTWLKPVKIGAGVAAGFLFFVAVVGSAGGSKDDKDADKVTPASTSSPLPSAVAAAPATSAPPTTAAPSTQPPPSTAAPVEQPTPPVEPTPEAVNIPDQPKADPPKRDTPKADPPKQDPPKRDPPKQDPPKQDPPKQDPPKKDPPPDTGGSVHPGAFCSPEGSTGTTVKGTLMICSAKPGDSRARWRAA
jgi:outer membrane biosynthesis protein TonB